MKINVHAGHSLVCRGASGILDEVNEDRKVKDRVIELLKSQGHTVYDCTDDVGKTQNQNLGNIVKKCNSHTVDLDVSIHLNSGRNDYGGDGSTGGVEVYNYDSRTKEISDRICQNISNSLGIRNRGTKYSKGLYVLNNTKALAILVECCFVDDRDDVNVWDTDKCAKAIVEGIIGSVIDENVGNVSTSNSFRVKVGISNLRIRTSPSLSGKIKKYIQKGVYTIVETIVADGYEWGKLKSGDGWIALKYVTRL